MTASPDPLATRRSELAALRNLHDAALDARVYVKTEAELINAGLGEPGRGHAPGCLERLDAALADAGELLERESS